MSTSYSVAVFWVLLTLCKLSFTNSEILSLQYSKEPVRKMEGESLSLKCTVEYDTEHCLDLITKWCFSGDRPPVNFDKHLIRINESRIQDKPAFRKRDVSIIFDRLLLNDTGLYQCVGNCADSGPSAMGHFINLTVTGSPQSTEKDHLLNNGLNKIDRDSTEIILLRLSGFILSWILLL